MALCAGMTAIRFAINGQFQDDPRSPAGAALTLVLLVATLALTWTYHRLRKTEGLV